MCVRVGGVELRLSVGDTCMDQSSMHLFVLCCDFVSKLPMQVSILTIHCDRAVIGSWNERCVIFSCCCLTSLLVVCDDLFFFVDGKMLCLCGAHQFGCLTIIRCNHVQCQLSMLVATSFQT